MKTRTIIFPFNESEENLKNKMLIIRDIVGEDNISYEVVPELTVRCNKKTWKKLKFKLDLKKSLLLKGMRRGFVVSFLSRIFYTFLYEKKGE